MAMLKILLGTDWVANQQAIMNLVANDVAEERSGRILMVPELISHSAERKLCEYAGDTASRFAEVLSFTRLARRVLKRSVTVIASAWMTAVASLQWQLLFRLYRAN